MYEEELNPEEFNVTMNIQAVRMMLGSIEYMLEVWPGAPKRPREEQEFLWDMRSNCQKMILEYTLSQTSI